MDKAYNPADIEQRIYQRWESSGCFAPSGRGESYCIMIPPPNVTGTLHMGHAFQTTIMDVLTRFYRMDGRNALWQPGMDHAGIATQMVVERQLNAESLTRQDLGREKFVERVWQWKEESGGMICRQQRRLGASLDWPRSRFTMDEGLSEAVLEVFVRLHDEGLIYRGKRLVNWDPVFHTALSDLEVLSSEEDGSLWHFRYPLIDAAAGEPEYLVVATTRPETMLGDTAVAVHPDDERFAHLAGRQVALPLTGRTIPVILDDYVDPEFGSGCVKITPAHDFNDYEIGRRHDLPMINIMTEDASINDNAPAPYRGLDREEARKRVVADLEQLGLLDKVDKHTLMVPRGDRSHAVVEPLLTDQWYVKIQPLADAAIEAVENGSIRFVPENWSKTYFDWMNNIQDWCISRQLWWGHRIPAWYDPQGNVYVGRSEHEIRERHDIDDGTALRQDDDVLDTWFSSALWPFSTLGWPQKTDALATFYPTSVLVTGFDIIFFWVARMIMMGLKFAGGVPFHEVYIHGLVRDEHGHKMSKAKGNVLDPLDIIDGIDLDGLIAKRTSAMMQTHLKQRTEKATRKEYPQGIAAYGTDALRFTFASLATTGRDINFDLGRVEGNRNFCNKIWNAARYVLLNCDSHLPDSQRELGAADRWIRSRLAATIETVRANMQIYRFDLAAYALYDFIWHEYCDWYLELTKPVLQNGADTPAANAARQTLLAVLEATLRLSHPVMPFISEEIWQRVAPKLGIAGDTIMTQPMPAADDFEADAGAEAEIEWVQKFVLGVRQIRGVMDISPSRPVPVLLHHVADADAAYLMSNRELIMELARLESVEMLSGEAPPASQALLGNMQILVPMTGLIDPVAESGRVRKQIEKQRKELARARGKLGNDKFVANAPAEIIARERQRAVDFESAIDKLEAHLVKVEALL